MTNTRMMDRTVSRELLKEFGLRPVINGRSFSTKCGGSLMDSEVMEANAGSLPTLL